MRKQEAGLPATPSQGSGLRGGRGQTLLEVLLAFSASILVLSAIIIGITTSLSNTQYTKNQNLANSYAKEGMAVVRQIRDSSWPKFSSYTTNTTYCLNQNSTELILASPPPVVCGQNPVAGIFFREVKLNHLSDDCSSGSIKGSKVTVKVSWSDSKCPVGTPFCHKVELITCFSNIDQKQAP